MGLRAGPYAAVAEALAGTPFASISYAEETESTNADAAVLLGDERQGGQVLVAEYQSRGAGRKGRTWLAPAGSALLFTAILPRAVETEALWIVPYWVALAVRTALLNFGITTTLQWPNDLLLRDRKLAGVLCQSSVSGSAARVACGVGINVRRPGADSGITPPPAYCDDVAVIDRAALLYAILTEYDRSLATLDRPWRVADAWNEAAELPGKRYRIMLDGDAASFEATAEGLATGGGLRVVRGDGRHETVALADATVLRQAQDDKG
jgi:BirA family transcriptional regulator, biotin operon repressor / biotin---[acetyl-CoA-carboxylase] ligase